MNNTSRLVLVFSMLLSLSLIVAAQAPLPASDGKNLADIAREIRSKRQSLNSPRVLLSPSQAGQKEAEYRSEIQALLARSAFAYLDAAAGKARTSKERFAGGVWKLYVFYDAAASPAAGDRATGGD